MFRVMDKMRHRDAFDVGKPTGTDFTGFDKSRQILLVTFNPQRPARKTPQATGGSQASSLLLPRPLLALSHANYRLAASTVSRVGPRHPAGIPGVEPLLGDAQR